MSKLIIVRGIPGSGKSTFAKTLGVKNINEADDYFIQNGVYVYEKDLLPQAHAWVYRKTRRQLLAGEDVVVSNVSNFRDDVTALLRIARTCGATAEVYTMLSRYKTIHAVSENHIAKMENILVVNEKYIAEDITAFIGYTPVVTKTENYIKYAEK